MADITATLTGQVTITGELTVPMGIVPRGEIEVTENGSYDVTNYETAQVAVPQPSGAVTITENGEHDVAQFAQAMVNVKGEVSAVTGTFSPTSYGGNDSVVVPYQGSGFPIATIIFVDGGARASGTEWYSLISMNAIGAYMAVKVNTTNPPTYQETSGENSQATVTIVYKSSTTNALVYSTAGNDTGIVYSARTPSSPAGHLVKWQSNTEFRYNQWSSSYSSGRYGFRKGITYRYYVIYSE